MSINLLFQKTNSCFVRNQQVEGLKILKSIWIKYPDNPRLFDEINKIIKNIRNKYRLHFLKKKFKNFLKCTIMVKLIS